MGKADASVDKDSVFSNYQSIYSRNFAVSLLVEFIGVMLFTFIGSTVTNPTLGPFVNGFSLAVWIYTAANISGGHLNPAVTFSTLICGFYPLLHSLLYIALQIVGGIMGILLVVGLMPGAIMDGGPGSPGCFGKGPELTDAQLFGWEALMTFTLISCVYACGVAKPGHGSFTPLAVGLALLSCAGSGAQWTGAALNPARVIGPLAVYKCGKGISWIYILAELFAALMACAVFAFVSGFGPLNPYTSMKTLGLTLPEAIKMFVTGSPPKRLAGDDDDNINELMHKMGVKDVRDVTKSQVQKRAQAAELQADNLPVKDNAAGHA